MHIFLEAIGFEQMKNTQIGDLLKEVVDTPHSMLPTVDSQGNEFIEFRRNYGDNIGIAVYGSYMEDGEFDIAYYYPYFNGSGITSEERLELEKHADKESYAIICDEIKVGVSLICYLQNVAEYLTDKKTNVSLTLSGLSLSGKIILPINKNEKQILNNEKYTQNRKHLIAAAREGDEDAIESLTLEDIDTYSMISRRIMNEDILSIVDSYFMPYGIESDQYSIMGEIINSYYITNTMTNQRLCVMTVDTNDLIYDICINEKDLLGEPLPGRRFKGNIWLQGKLNFTS